MAYDKAIVHVVPPPPPPKFSTIGQCYKLGTPGSHVLLQWIISQSKQIEDKSE